MAFVIDPKPQKEAVKEVVHKTGCGALIGYIANDIEVDYDSDYTGGTDYYKFIRCPQCGGQIRVRG